MAIIYRGRDEVLKERFDEVKPILAEAYMTILGPTDYERLEKTASRVLTPESFIHSAQDAKANFGDVIQFPPKNASMAFISEELDLDKPKKRGEKYECSAVIFASKDSIKHSSYTETTDNPLAPLIHEFNHFVWFALQKIPYYTLNQTILNELNPKPTTHKINVDDQIKAISTGSYTPAETKYQVALTLYAHMLTKMYEDTNRILDKHIMESIGINVDYSWRHQPKQFKMMILPGVKTIAGVPFAGDSVADFTDSEAIQRTIDWEEHLTFQSNEPRMTSLVNKVRKIRMRKIPVLEIIADEE